MTRPPPPLFVLVLVLVLVAATGAPAPALAQEHRVLRAAPVLGYAGPDAITIWVAPPTATAGAAAAQVEVAIAPDLPDGAVERVVPFPFVTAGELGTRVRIEGLVPDRPYRYRILVDGAPDPMGRGSFRTGPEPGAKGQKTIALVSCMHAQRCPEQPAWTRLAEEKPDLLISLGDNIYANSTVPEVVNRWYLQQRNVPEYAQVARSTPALAIWDDHDFGANDSDGTLPGKERSLALFRALWPNPHPGGLPGAPGVFFKASFGDVDLFLLDTRYHRSPNAAPDDDSKQMLGEAQFAWLEKGLRASRASFKIVASGSTISAAMKDCWLQYTRDRARLVGLTRDVPGIVFVTGDIHTSLVGRSEPGAAAGYPVYEVVSSGIAVNPRYCFFVTLAVDTGRADPTITTTVFKLEKDGSLVEKKVREIKKSELAPSF